MSKPEPIQTVRTIPLIELQGTPEESGYQYGRLARERIVRCYELYAGLFDGVDDAWLEDRGNLYFELVSDQLPHLGAELAAVASGCGLPVWKLACLNARTELYLQNCEDAPVECTAAAFPQTGLLGQNWDWVRASEDLVVLLDIARPDGFRILTMTEPGLLAKIGLNNAGIGVSLNILPGKPTSVGIPVHVLLRRLLELTDLADAVELLESISLDTYSNILLMDREGRYLNLELNGPRIEIIQYGDECPVHTNHFLATGVPIDEVRFRNSIHRLSRARTICTDSISLDRSAMQALFQDREGGEDAICRDYRPSQLLRATGPQMEIGTVCSIIMDLRDQTMWLSRGRPSADSYVRYSIR